MPIFGPPNVQKLVTRQDVAGLIKALRYKEGSVRASASEALGEVGGVQAVEPLIAALSDEKSEVARAAARSLGTLGDDRAVEPLIASLRSDDAQIRQAACSALERFSGSRATTAVAEFTRAEAARHKKEQAEQRERELAAAVRREQAMREAYERAPQPHDDTLESGERMTRVVTQQDLVPGDAIRIWHEDLNRWIPGWWQEVVRIEGDRVYLHDLKTGESLERSFADTRGAYKHPAPPRLKNAGARVARAEAERLASLRRQYDALDYGRSSDAEMLSALKGEIAWRKANRDNRYDIPEEFDIRQIAITKIGEELNKRGGMTAMRQMGERVGSPEDKRTLDMLWDGIGEWRG